MQRAWLPPSAASLTALALHPTPATWLDPPRRPRRRSAPAPPIPTMGRRPSFLLRMLDPAVLDEAVRLLDLPGEDAVDWNAPVVRPVYEAAVALAALAREARRPGRPTAIRTRRGRAACWRRWAGSASALRTPPPRPPAWPTRNSLRNPSQTQRRRWGMDQAALARRLGRRWRLPDWLTAVVGCLRLPPELARPFRPRSRPVALRASRRRTGAQRGMDLGLGIVGRLAPRVGRADSRSEWPTILHRRSGNRRIGRRCCAICWRRPRTTAGSARRRTACVSKRKSIGCTKPWKIRRSARTAG